MKKRLIAAALCMIGLLCACDEPEPAAPEVETAAIATETPEPTEKPPRDGDYAFFVEELPRNKIKTITFQSTWDQWRAAPDDAHDISNKFDIIKMWAEENGDLYDVYIVSPYKVFFGADYSDLFRDCVNLTAIDFNDSFITYYATDMSGMFYNCRKLTHLDLEQFDTRNVTDMSFMFADCRSLDVLTISNVGFDTANVRDMSYMFWNCHALELWPFEYITTPKVRRMTSMFQNCTSLEKVYLTGFDVRNVTDMSYMFAGCKSLTAIAGQGNLRSETANTTDMYLGTKWE